MSFAATLAVVSVGVAFASTASAAVYRYRLRHPRTHSVAGDAVTLIMAVTGDAEQLARLVDELASQTMRPRRLILGIESELDPAFRAASRIASSSPIPIEIAIGGEANASSQKCANLIAACRRIDERDRVVAFLDADIRPPRWWLETLVTPLSTGRADIVTGYRWPTIERATAGSHLIIAIDRAVGLLPRLRWAEAVWGGSIATSADALRRMRPERMFAATLSDDLAIGRTAAELELRVLWRGALLVPTPLSHDLASAWRFGRRQYQMVRLYRPALWAAALSLVALQLLVWCLLLAGAIHDESLRGALALVLLLGVIRQALTQNVGTRLGFGDTGMTRALQYGLSLASPLVDGFHLSMILGAARVRRVTWAHVRYRVDARLNIRIEHRTAWPRSAP